ncbi:hypothetical protein [Enterococcus massiliensis]|uniref:hypothetical protein n=1 Tax=Enterococcus massiliensis TaxID=1640685 RepID=UPI00065DBE8D|nr:hypothetical protein [Enterococcus massiliensis]
MPKDLDDKLERLAKQAKKEDPFDKIDEMEKELNLDEEIEDKSMLEDVLEDTPAAAADQLRPKQ